MLIPIPPPKKNLQKFKKTWILSFDYTVLHRAEVLSDC